MPEMRLFHRDLFQSSLYYHIGDAVPGHELHAQRLFETLILMADDYGRGRFIPADIRTRAFSSAPSAFAEVSLQDIDEWMAIIEDNGSAFRYGILNECYFFLPKWYSYQSLKYRKKSRFPVPTPEFLAERRLVLEASGQIVPIEDKTEAELEKMRQLNEAKRSEAKNSEANRSEKNRSEAEIASTGQNPLTSLLDSSLKTPGLVNYDPRAIELSDRIVDTVKGEKFEVWIKRLNYDDRNQRCANTALSAVRTSNRVRNQGAYFQGVYQKEGGTL